MRRIDYVIQYVELLDQSVAFYRDVIALKARIEGDGYVEFEMDNAKFSLFERSKLTGLIGREGGNPPCGEIGFLVDDVDAEAARLCRLDVETLSGPVGRPWGKGRSTSPTRTATSSNSRRSCDDSASGVRPATIAPSVVADRADDRRRDVGGADRAEFQHPANEVRQPERDLGDPDSGLPPFGE